jgi:hypothetical protein
MNIKSVLNILIGIILCGVSTGPVVFASDSPGIENLVIKDVFEPGNGPAVGKIRQVSGTAVIMHQAQDFGYRASIDLVLFEGDTVLTGKDASLAFKLNDGSFISMSSDTEMTISKSVYAPKQKSRSSFLNMVAGKARFVVKKFVDARYSEFKVKTKTSVNGVRGSDFIIYASETVSEITTLEKTELEVISLAEPDAEPVILNSFEKTKIRIGMRPEEAEKVKFEEVDRLMKEFKFLPTDQSPIEQTFAVSAVSVLLENIYVEKNDLVSPRFDDIRHIDQDNSLQDLFRSKSILMDQHNIEEQNIRIYQDKKEDIQIKPLPGFPGLPGEN